jgi:bacillithiol biosynthesis cysteine-adding enzyme BshC
VKISGCSFSKLPFTELFTDYTNKNEQLDGFFPFYPADNEQLLNAAQNRDQGHVVDRKALVDALLTFNDRFDLPDGWQDNVRRFEDEQSVAIVTGQQSHLYGGPLYTIYKILSAIALSTQLESQLNRPVIPVFWLGDEDHDYDEVNTVHLPDKERLQRITLDRASNGEHRVCDLTFGKSFSDVREELRNQLISTDFSEQLWNLLDESYSENNTFGYAAAHFFGQLFTKHGLVIAGSNHAEIKQILAPAMQQSVMHHQALREALEQTSDGISNKYHQQVTLYESNLFWIDPNGRRIKINKEEDHWSAGDQQQWSTDIGLSKAIEAEPERFSPNVFMRPILQDHLLPTVAYVGGPGEISYYAQMKGFYEQFDLEMPLIWPRMSATLIDSPIERVLEKLPFAIEAYQQRIEDLESAYVEQADTMDIESVFGSWKEATQELSEPYEQKVANLDPTLESAAGKAVQSFFNELDRLKGKVYRATKQQEKTQINRIHKIKNELFPEQGLQERSISFIYYMNKHGVDIWDRLLDSMKGMNYDEHHWIYIDQQDQD